MKKLVILFAVAMMAVSAQAQTVTESKTFDNFYVGINGGLATKEVDEWSGPECRPADRPLVHSGVWSCRGEQCLLLEQAL